MSKWIKIALFLVGLFVLGGGLIWLSIRFRAEGKSQASQSEERIFPHIRINRIAGALSGSDESAIRELIDAVFRASGLYRVPKTVIRPFKERLIRSEISHRSGRITGVSEESIVHVIDQLAEKFAAPEFARTSQDEVRELRLGLSRLMPDFITPRPLEKGAILDQEIGFSVNPVMSPVEAIFVLQHLIRQKEASEYYQLTPAERSAVNKVLQRLHESGIRLSFEESADVRMELIHQELNNNALQRTPEELAALAKRRSAERRMGSEHYILTMMPSTPRRGEMEAVMQRAGAMRIGEALELAHRSLDVLGIER